MWGLPDFVFRPKIIAKGSGQRELGDATIITGSKAVAVKVKSREGEPKDDDAEGRWLTKKAVQGARQAAGTVRALRASAADLANERGRTVTCHGDQLTWMGVVILDHAAARRRPGADVRCRHSHRRDAAPRLGLPLRPPALGLCRR